MSLEVRDVTVRFGGHTALDAVAVDAPAGAVTGLIGPNGAGKTTLFNVITGVQRAAGGSVLLDGAPLDGLAPHARAKRGLGRTFQRLELFSSLTVRENIRVAVSARPGRQTTKVATATDELIDRLDLGAIADTRADSLSTGTGRIVELGRCLALDPKVLLLDEPASGQDDQETERFATVLTELAAAGTAVLLVEHDMDLVMRVCDRIHVLDFGRLLASGTPAEIQADAKVRAAYLGDEVPA
ncbi:ABC transporter ATP-binding protein [Aquihabitans sp. McL0605]|uniref:ABC transporter ATP-binding protein n=1 Tax=Aquihabitans sp. McL0605 TaxID=3415671 RepID=UPI003CF5ECAD